MSHSPSVSRSIHKVSYRDLYKSPTSSSGGTRNMIYQSDDCNGSPVDGGCLNWRSAYKKRCFDEFKKSRQKLLCKFRNLELSNEPKSRMKDYIEIELQKICILHANTMQNLPSQISIDEAIEMYNQIQSELLSSSKSFKDFNDNEIEELMKSIENDQQSALEDLSRSSTVCCPLCQKSNLYEKDQSTIVCNSSKCNFNVDIHKSGFNLSLLNARLESILNEHKCSEIPCFQFKNVNEFNNNDYIMLNQIVGGKSVSFYLLATCQNCNFLDVIA